MNKTLLWVGGLAVAGLVWYEVKKKSALAPSPASPAMQPTGQDVLPPSGVKDDAPSGWSIADASAMEAAYPGLDNYINASPQTTELSSGQGLLVILIAPNGARIAQDGTYNAGNFVVDTPVDGGPPAGTHLPLTNTGAWATNLQLADGSYTLDFLRKVGLYPN